MSSFPLELMFPATARTRSRSMGIKDEVVELCQSWSDRIDLHCGSGTRKGSRSRSRDPHINSKSKVRNYVLGSCPAALLPHITALPATYPLILTPGKPMTIPLCQPDPENSLSLTLFLFAGNSPSLGEFRFGRIIIRKRFSILRDFFACLIF